MECFVAAAIALKELKENGSEDEKYRLSWVYFEPRIDLLAYLYGSMSPMVGTRKSKLRKTIVHFITIY